MKHSLIHAAIIAERNLPCAFKLRPAQIYVLLLIKENRLCYLSELCCDTPYDRSTITKAVAFLRNEVQLIQEYAPHSYVLTDAGAEYCLQLEEIFYSSL